MFRSSHVVVGALGLVATACNDNTTNFVNNIATVRFVNDTDTPIVVSPTGIPDSTTTTLIFGAASACAFVDLSSASTPVLSVKNAATGASIAIIPVLTVGDNVTIVAFGDTTGPVQLTALSNRFVPVASDAGLRFFNGDVFAGPMTMQRNGVTLTPLTAFGSASSFLSVPIDSAHITFSNTVSVVLDAGQMAFPQGQNSTVFVGPPAAGTVPLRFFTVQGC